MSQHSEATREQSVEAAGSPDLPQGGFSVLREVFDKVYPLVLILSAVALVASLLQILAGKGPAVLLSSQILLYLALAVLILLRRRLPPQLVFSLILGFIYVLAVVALFNRGLAGTGIVHMIFFCVIAGFFFSLGRALAILLAGLATVALIGFGISTGLLHTARTDAADYLLHPVNWLIQISCIVLYAVPLILANKALLKKMADSQRVLRETNRRLEAEVDVRQQTESRFRESEERYRKIVENAVEGIFQISAKGRLLSANPALVQMMGYGSAEEMIAEIKDFRSHGYVEPAERRALVTAMKEQGAVMGYEVRLFRKDRTMAWVSVNGRAVRDQAGSVLYYECFIEDITKRKEAEQALIESEANYRGVVESSVAGFFTVQDGVFRFINHRASEITGYSYDETVNVMPVAEPIHPDDRVLAEEQFRRCLGNGGEMVRFDARIVCKNGKCIEARFLIGPTLYHEAPAISGSFIDMTREKSLEAQLRQAQKMEAVGRLASGVAHDFNNVLTAFNGYGKLLQLRTPPEDPRRNYVDQILSAASKAEGLTQSLLTFSRQQPITLTPVELNRHIRETEKLLGRLLTEDIVFSVQLGAEPINTLADATQIDRVLFNLVSNARDAMPGGGRFRLETSVAVLDQEFRECHGFGKPGPYACLTLTDTGVGMDKATVEQVFNPFFTTKGPGQGTGLGLATVYGIVKQHGGYITVESETGRGATFRVYFPAIQAKAAESPPTAPEALSAGQETILIADDDEDVRAFVRDVLTFSGYRIIEAVDGREALAVFRATPAVSLVILDTVMPNLNGREAYEAMREDAPGLKSLFISGYPREVIAIKGVRDGACDFLPKPLLPTPFVAKVREILDR